MAVSTEETKVEVGEAQLSNISEICSFFNSALASAIADSSKKEVVPTSPQASSSTLQDIEKQNPSPQLLVEIGYQKGIVGRQFFSIAEEAAGKLAALAQGKEVGKSPKLDEAGIAAMKGVFESALSANLATIGTVTGGDALGAIAGFEVVALKDRIDNLSAALGGGSVVTVSAVIKITDPALEVPVVQIVPVQFGIAEGQEAAASPSPESVLDAMDDDVERAQFSSLSPGATPANMGNIELLMDIALDASIELGRTQMSIKEILALGSGSVVELEKAAGEAADFLVNGKIIARGEVVVIDGKFGIRLTEIASPRERLESV